MTFTQSIATCFSKYATFSGRASRSEFWWAKEGDNNENSFGSLDIIEN